MFLSDIESMSAMISYWVRATRLPSTELVRFVCGLARKDQGDNCNDKSNERNALSEPKSPKLLQ